MAIQLNPMVQTVAPGFFNTQSDGYVQGTAMDDPATRYALTTGVLASTETLPTWGGCAMTELIPSDPTSFPATTPWSQLGAVLQRATTTITAFAVFNQAHNMITTPQSTVPTSQANMTVSYYRLGSGARIALACDPALASLYGAVVGAANQVSWDFHNMMLQPYVASGGTQAISSIVVANGVATATLSGAITGWTITVGDYVNISGATNSGTAPVGLLNQAQKVTSVTSPTVFTFNLPTNQGTWGTIGGSPVLTYGGTSFTCKILHVAIGNSKVVRWDSQNNVATWDDTGSCAVVLI